MKQTKEYRQKKIELLDRVLADVELSETDTKYLAHIIEQSDLDEVQKLSNLLIRVYNHGVINGY